VSWQGEGFRKLNSGVFFVGFSGKVRSAPHLTMEFEVRLISCVQGPFKDLKVSLLAVFGYAKVFRVWIVCRGWAGERGACTQRLGLWLGLVRPAGLYRLPAAPSLCSTCTSVKPAAWHNDV